MPQGLRRIRPGETITALRAVTTPPTRRKAGELGLHPCIRVDGVYGGELFGGSGLMQLSDDTQIASLGRNDLEAELAASIHVPSIRRHPLSGPDAGDVDHGVEVVDEGRLAEEPHAGHPAVVTPASASMSPAGDSRSAA